MDIYQFLALNDVDYVRTDHPPVYTCEEAERLVPSMPGTNTKNLFLRDKKGRRHFLVVVGYEKTVDLKALSSVLQVSNLSLASPERLRKFLGIAPGSVSLLSLVNDSNCEVEVVLDKSLGQAETLKCHPLVNTSTLAIRRTDVERIFEVTGHRIRKLSVPERKQEPPHG